MTNYASFSDKELIQMLSLDKEPAFNEIYKRYSPGVFLIARNRLQNDLEAEEIMQDIFCNLWRMRATLYLEKGLKAYLSVAVKYGIINRSVKRRRDNAFIERLAQRIPQQDLCTQETINFNELKKNLMESICQLPERCQLVFRLKFDKDYSQKKIAEELNISEKTVESHLSKARKHLRISLGSVLPLSVLYVLNIVLK